MRILKWVVAVVLVLYALWSAMPALFTTLFKLGSGHPMAGQEKYVPLMQATSPIQLVIWWAGILLFLWTAWRVARGERAFRFYATGFVLDIGGWLLMKLGPVYNQVFQPSEQMLDYVLILVLLLAGMAIWSLDRREPMVAPAV
jgi:hypothetical protein